MPQGNNFGWMGMVSQVESYLHVVGADQDDKGNFLLVGEPDAAPSTFMGAGEECVIPAGCCYLKGGKPVNLSAGLRETSYGFGVVVI